MYFELTTALCSNLQNWDEESSDEDDSDLEQLEDIPEKTEDEGPRNKRRKTQGVE